MNRKRALYRYELENMKWFFVAGVGCCLFVLFLFNSTCREMSSIMEYAGFESRYASFSSILIEGLQRCTPLALFALAIMVTFQFSDYHKRRRREYIVSLPYTQRERFMAKLVTGASILTIVCALFGAGIFFLRNIYFQSYVKSYMLYPQYRIFCGNDTWFHVLRTILLLWIILLTAYAMFTLVHSLVAGGVMASLISLGVLATPFYLWNMIYIYIDFFASDLVSSGRRGHDFLQICASFIGFGYYKNTVDLEYGRNFAICIDYGPLWLVFLVQIVVLIVCTVVAAILNAKQDGAKFGVLIPVSWARAFFSAGIALCFSFPLALLIAFCLGIDGFGIAVAVLQAIWTVVLYFVNQKIFQRVIR